MTAPPTRVQSVPKPEASAGWLELRIWAEMHWDLQKHRISSENRTGASHKTPIVGVDPDVYAPHIADLLRAEKSCENELVRAYKRIAPPELVAWQETTPGVGDKTFARLLGVLGDPLTATPWTWVDGAPPDGHTCNPQRCGTDRHLVALEPYERGVAQLWAYAGYGDPERKRRKGMTADDAMALGNPRCKTLLYLIVENVVKASVRKMEGAAAKFSPESRHALNPLGELYLEGRSKYVERDWTDGHRQAATFRLIAKELLRQMWLTRKNAQQTACHAIPKLQPSAGLTIEPGAACPTEPTHDSPPVRGRRKPALIHA